MSAWNTIPGSNQDACSPPPESKIPEVTLPPGEVIFKVVEHLAYDSWNVAGTGYYLGHIKNTPVKDVKLTITLPKKGPEPYTTDAEGCIKFTGQENDGKCTVEWKCPDVKLNNSYYWYYERNEPIKLTGEIDPRGHKDQAKGYDWMPSVFMPKDDPKGKPISWKVDQLTVGRVHFFSVYRPPVIIDSHMHIESGHCAPIPLIWNKVPKKMAFTAVGRFVVKRWVIENAAKIYGTYEDLVMLKPAYGLVRRFGGGEPDDDGNYYRHHRFRRLIPLQEKNSFDISVEFITVRDKLYNEFQALNNYKHTHLVLPSMVMPMDMEYAHIDGYFGIKILNAIYENDDPEQEPFGYWFPLHGIWGNRGDGQYIRTDDAPATKSNDALSKKQFEIFKKDVKANGLSGAYIDIDKKSNQPVLKGMRVKCTPCVISDKEAKTYEHWKKQLKYTQKAILTHPLKLLSLYHYDPRRWYVLGNNDPLKQVTNKGLFIGFKIYTAQGYRPWDVRRLPILEKFYKSCSELKIPIMNHCTPEGASTFNRDEYIDFRHFADTAEDDRQKEVFIKRYKFYDGYEENEVVLSKNAEGYFNEHFVSPNAWRPVLERYRKLRLCLAHFGGNKDTGKEWGIDIIKMMIKYDNLYADISSSFANEEFKDYFMGIIMAKENEHLKNRILFGTDWYLTLMDDKKNVKDFPEYCRKAREKLDAYDTSLWVRFTCVNPIRFYRLHVQIGRILDNIIAARENDDTLKPLSRNKLDELRKDTALIKKAYETHEAYWKTPIACRKGL